MRLKIEDLYFSFNTETPIISGLNFSLSKSQITSIVGNSGCGKSTLLNLITGLLYPSSGKISPVSNFSYLTQAITLLPYLTAFENCLLACELKNKLNAAKVHQANLIFEKFNLKSKIKAKFPTQLSGGMKQRIGLIQTLLVDADLFLLDEPFNAIDRGTSLVIQNYLWHRFKRDEISAIIVTHDLDQSILTSDKILTMPNGTNNFKEIIFDRHFTSLSPEQRLNTDLFDEYLVQVIKSLNSQ